MGFALFTASVTWILQIYPNLGRRRALAVRLRQLSDQLDAQYLGTQGDRGQVIAAYRRDHRQ